VHQNALASNFDQGTNLDSLSSMAKAQVSLRLVSCSHKHKFTSYTSPHKVHMFLSSGWKELSSEDIFYKERDHSISNPATKALGRISELRNVDRT